MGYETYVGISREQLLVKMQQLLPEKRFKHCLGVEQAAIDLAERFGVDVEKVNTLNYDGKVKRMGRSIGKTASYKKAVVKLTADSKEIEFFRGM